MFRSLFRGRDDVYPVLWTSARTGRTGYSPACGNEWVEGVCEKPRVRCGACPNQAFHPVSDRVILDHLQGRHVAGVYPLLPNETCRFLAVDFDKREWMKDVSAFRSACESLGLPVAVERSRSGQGAHAWFFFDTPVSATAARRMGCHLITVAMSLHPGLGMSSYDRLFPNQDTMPRGGFGNLIALPLQRKPRNDGNTVFINEAFRPYSDQWAFLAAIERIPASTVQRIAEEARRDGQILGVHEIGLESEATPTPWLLPPSRRSPSQIRVDKATVPMKVDGTLAHRLFIAKGHLPSSIVFELRRLAAFRNPEFYRKQALRLSTALTTRVIACAEDFPQHLALPRGCVDSAVSLLRSLGTSLQINDRRELGRTINYRFTGTPTALQVQAVRKVLDHDTGVLVAPPGFGKTVAGIQLIAARSRNTLILVHRQPLFDQWIAQLAHFLGIEQDTIGRIGGGKRHVTGEIDVAMIQSLVRNSEVADLVADYGHVIVDECHHVPAQSFERVVSEVRARYVTGLTATPKRRDGLHPILEMQLGPVRYLADPTASSEQNSFARRLIVRETELRVGEELDMPIQRLYKTLSEDAERNDMIIDDVIASLEAGRSPIVLTERKDHLDRLEAALRGFTRHLVVLKGGATAKKRRTALELLHAIPDVEERLVLATGRFVGEGFDDARLDTLFLTMPVSWRGTVIQYAGRLHRLHARKTDVRIYDYVDSEVPMLARMYQRRLRAFRSIGYSVEG